MAVLFALAVLPVIAAAQGASPEARRAAVEAFWEVVSDWQQEAWGKIYDQATARSRKAVTRQAFIRIMERTGARLRGDERAIEIVEVSSKYPTLIELAVILGYRRPRMAFKRETFQMEWEAGRWRISAVAILYADPEEVPPPPLVEH